MSDKDVQSVVPVCADSENKIKKATNSTQHKLAATFSYTSDEYFSVGLSEWKSQTNHEGGTLMTNLLVKHYNTIPSTQTSIYRFLGGYF